MSDARKWNFRLTDMMECIQHIERLVKDHKNENDFHADLDAYRAVERNFEIIAEASKHIPEQVKAEYPEMAWGDLIGMRNVISHNYEGVDEVVLWSAVQNNVPRLKGLLTQLMEKYGDRP